MPGTVENSSTAAPLNAMVDACREELHARLRRFVVSSLPTAGAGDLLPLVNDPGASLLHPALMSWQDTLTEQHRAGRHAQVAQTARELPAVLGEVRLSQARAHSELTAHGIACDIPDEAAGRYRQVLSAMAAVARKDGNKKHPDPVLLGRDDVIAMLADSVALVKATWNARWSSLARDLKVMIFYRDDDIKSFTSFRTHGAIYVAYMPHQPHAHIDLAKDIVHEASHTQLNQILICRRVLADRQGSATYVTPLRRDKRPPKGVLHQYFVLANLANFLRRVGETCGPEWTADAEKLAAEARDCERILVDERLLTPDGAQFTRMLSDMTES